MKLIEVSLEELDELGGLGLEVFYVTLLLFDKRKAFLEEGTHYPLQLLEGSELGLLEVEVIDDVDHSLRLVLDLVLLVLSLFKSKVLSSLGSVGALDLKHPPIVHLLVWKTIIEHLVLANQASEYIHLLNNKYSPTVASSIPLSLHPLSLSLSSFLLPPI